MREKNEQIEGRDLRIGNLEQYIMKNGREI